MSWSYSLDTATPDGATQAVSVLDNHIRLVKQAMRERLTVDHMFDLTGTQVSDTDAGKHRKLTFFEGLSAKPTLESGECAVYTKEVDGVPELFFEAEDGTELQLTSGGKLMLADNDVYLTVLDAAGTGTIDLIKGGRNEADDTDVVVISDEARTATNAAPTEDTQLANKKYVDEAYQVEYTESGTRAVCSTTIPHDNTIPQVGEGTEVMTRTFTPKSASSLLRIDVVVLGSPYTSLYPAAALFETSVDAANALAVGSMGIGNTAEIGAIKFTHFMASPGVSALTFRVRAGCGAGSFYFNGTGTASMYGGVLASSISITEYPGSGS